MAIVPHATLLSHLPKVSIQDLRAHVSDAVSRVTYREERIIITRNGKAVAALIPIEDLEFLESLDDQVDQETSQAIEAGRAEFQRGEATPLSQLRRRPRRY